MTHQAIDPTPASLLLRLQVRTDQEAWRRFVRLYAPLLYAWARRLGFSPDDATDRVQDTFLLLAVKLPEFEYDDRGRFRGWLWTVFLNRCREARRRGDVLSTATYTPMDQLAGNDTIAESVEAEFRGQLVRSSLELMRAEFPETTWQAFWRYVALGEAPAEVAGDLGVSVDLVYQAKTRVLRRLRQAFAGLLD
jgi:RNA polymerase sigma-70 factor (ECF subfamily)